MILGSVRISKKTNLQGGLIHNCYSNKSVTNECMNDLYEVNDRGQIRNGKFLRDGKHSSMFDRLKKDFTDYQLKVKEDYNKNNKQKLRKDANMFFEGVISFGSSKGEDFDKRIRELSNNEMFIGSVIKSVRDILKENGIEGDFKLFQHNDEKSVHFHFDFVPYNWNTHKMVNQEFSPSYMSKIQDILYINLKEYGIHRGIKKEDRIQKYCENNNIQKEDLTKEDYQKMNIKNKSLKQHNNNLEKTNRELEKKIERYENDIFPKMIQKFNSANKKLQLLKKQIQEQERELRNQNLSKQKLKEELIILGNEKKEIQKNINGLKDLKKDFESNRISVKNIEKLFNDNIGMFKDNKKGFENISKQLYLMKEEQVKEIKEELKTTKEDKEYYQKEKNILSKKYGKLEEENNYNLNKSNRLEGENQNLKIEVSVQKELTSKYYGYYNVLSNEEKNIIEKRYNEKLEEERRRNQHSGHHQW